jgi:hypothetical protein
MNNENTNTETATSRGVILYIIASSSSFFSLCSFRTHRHSLTEYFQIHPLSPFPSFCVVATRLRTRLPSALACFRLAPLPWLQWPLEPCQQKSGRHSRVMSSIDFTTSTSVLCTNIRRIQQQQPLLLVFYAGTFNC